MVIGFLNGASLTVVFIICSILGLFSTRLLRPRRPHKICALLKGGSAADRVVQLMVGARPCSLGSWSASSHCNADTASLSYLKACAGERYAPKWSRTGTTEYLLCLLEKTPVRDASLPSSCALPSFQWHC